uniref:Uncharacterized protein n=1 Tax=Rhizophora mucronata TaxID=61149 RepID=A0A2P2PBV5_RHIMU
MMCLDRYGTFLGDCILSISVFFPSLNVLIFNALHNL